MAEPSVPSVIVRWKLLYCFSNSVEGSVVDGSRIYSMLGETRIVRRSKIICEALPVYDDCMTEKFIFTYL
jgi:hypothetical protein